VGGGGGRSLCRRLFANRDSTVRARNRPVRGGRGQEATDLRGVLVSFPVPGRDAQPSTSMTPVPVEIRRANRADIPVVGRLARTIWHAHYPGIITPEQIEYMLERGYSPEALEGFLGRPDRGLELAIADGVPAGFAAWYVTGDPAEAKLDKLYVLPSHQRHGLGGGLIRRVAELAGAAGATRLVLNDNKRNDRAIRAYGRYGFAIRESVVVDIGNGFVMDDYVMASPLPMAAGLPARPPDANILR
jgi:GNAT superfamily N-acetyltransferase